jgi:hypothetical protein
MKNQIQLINKFNSICNSLARVAQPGERFLLLFAAGSALGFFTLVPSARAVSPPPDGGYPDNNTAEGTDALFSLTTGHDNTAIGFDALFKNTTGIYNTVNGSYALFSNTTGGDNTANGYAALFSNTTSFFNTANGAFALSSNNTGFQNTANGFNALYSNTTGNNNTANGASALISNTTGVDNTASGFEALYSNTTGNNNTANGVDALYSNTTASNNTANGFFALVNNITGVDNTANGFGTLYSNTTGNDNTANGNAALYSNAIGNNNTANGNAALYLNTTGSSNTAYGLQALYSNTIGNNNTADGLNALFSNTTGSSNIALGDSAGSLLTTGKNNIDIGNVGMAGESAKIRIGNKAHKNTFIAGISGVTVAGGVGVIIDSTGHFGTVTSSERYKDAIQPMDKASEAILALKPVTFRYKHELDPAGIPQFGLVAEQVEKVNPDLVARDENGKPFSVRYEAVNAMLLNEFLKEHRKVEEQQAIVTQLRAVVAKQEICNAQQQTKMEGLTAALKEQAAQIQKVSDQLRTQAISPRVVANN